MNPCPCGYYTHPSRECRCSVTQVQHYNNKISGPLLDRIDLHIEAPAVEYSDLSKLEDAESSSEIHTRVVEARRIQLERFKRNRRISVNADIGPKEIKKYCRIDTDGEKLLKAAMETMGLSARGYDRILKVSRTIADLDGGISIRPEHLAEAIQYRSMDRELWM